MVSKINNFIQHRKLICFLLEMFAYRKKGKINDGIGLEDLGLFFSKLASLVDFIFLTICYISKLLVE